MQDARNVVSRQNQRLQFTEEARSGATLFECRGSFSLVSHDCLDKLVQKMRRVESRRVVLDMRQVLHMDSTGMGTLATAFKDLRAAGKDLVLVPSQEVRSSLAAVSLDRVFSMKENVESALGPD